MTDQNPRPERILKARSPRWLVAIARGEGHVYPQGGSHLQDASVADEASRIVEALRSAQLLLTVLPEVM